MQTTTAIIVAIGIMTALVMEALKLGGKEFTAKQTNLITLGIGLVVSVVITFATGLEFATSLTASLTGAVLSGGIYDYVVNLLGLKIEEQEQ